MRIKHHLNDLYHHIMPGDRYSVLRRYGLLENAVINYSGGIADLERRVRKSLARSETIREELLDLFSMPATHSRKEELLRLSDDIKAEFTLLLTDVHVYLRDVRKFIPRGEE